MKGSFFFPYSAAIEVIIFGEKVRFLFYLGDKILIVSGDPDV